MGKLPKRPNIELAPFYRRLGSDYVNFLRRGNFLVRQPIGLILVGFHFDPKEGMRNCRWLQTITYPLYIKTENLTLGFGDRIPRNPDWGLDSFWVYVGAPVERPEHDAKRVMDEIGLPTLDRLQDPRALYEDLLSRERSFIRPRDYWAARVMTSVELGRTELAVREMQLYDEDWHKPTRPANNEEVEKYEQARYIVYLAQYSGLRQARKQLRIWRIQTLESLGLKEFASEVPLPE